MPELAPSAETSQHLSMRGPGNEIEQPSEKLAAVKSMKHLMAKKKLTEVVQTMGRLQLAMQEPDTRPINGAVEHRLAIMSSSSNQQHQPSHQQPQADSSYSTNHRTNRPQYYAVDAQELAKQKQRR